METIAERTVDQNSIGVRLDARGLKHRQVCKGGKHMIEVRIEPMNERHVVFTGTRQELEAWLSDFGAMNRLDRQWGRWMKEPVARIERVYASAGRGHYGWLSDAAFAYVESEIEPLRASAKKIGGRICVDRF